MIGEFVDQSLSFRMVNLPLKRLRLMTFSLILSVDGTLNCMHVSVTLWSLALDMLI